MPILRLLLSLMLALGAFAQDVPAEAPASLTERLQKEALAAAESSTAALAGSRTFRVLRPPVIPKLKPGKIDLELSHLSKADATGPFFVTFKLLLDGRPAGFARVDLEGRWNGKLLKATKALARLAVPGPDDLEEVDFEGNPPPGALLEFPDGYRLKNPIPSGRVLTRSDIQPIPIIKAGDQVRVIMVCGPLSISLGATARSSAAMGEKVRLELPNGRKAMMAKATGPGEATVEWNL